MMGNYEATTNGTSHVHGFRPNDGDRNMAPCHRFSRLIAEAGTTLHLRSTTIMATVVAATAVASKTALNKAQIIAFVTNLA